MIFEASALWAVASYKSKHPFVHLFVCLFVCLFVRLSTFEVPFERLFAPTSLCRMSKIFRDSEALGKSNGKKWSHISKLSLIKGVKSPRKCRLDYSLIIHSIVHFLAFLFTFFKSIFGSGGYTTRIWSLLAGFFWYLCYYPQRLRDALSPVCGIFFLLILDKGERIL